MRTAIHKIIPKEELARWRENLCATRRPLVVTNGCFDIVHAGHVRMLEEARQMGAFLLVGVTGDDGVRVLKGGERPYLPGSERALMLAGLEVVGAVSIFEQVDAREFLSRARPDIYVKGGDYHLDSIQQDERRLLETMGAAIRFTSYSPNRSTRALVEKIRACA